MVKKLNAENDQTASRIARQINDYYLDHLLCYNGMFAFI